MGPPGGGPVDDIPPVVLAASPPTGSTAVDVNAPIVFELSEPVDAASAAEALFFSPIPSAKPRIKSRGNNLVIRLKDPIPTDRTMVATLGSGVRDLHGNTMRESVTVALTAGTAIDSGLIRGRIFAADNLQGVLVGAWRVTDSLTADPAEVPPDYITQTANDGGFTLDYLADGGYRIASWDDRDHDRLYDPAVDRLGVAWRDFLPVKDANGFLEIYHTKRDTAGARILYVAAPDNRHIFLRLNRVSPAGISNFLSAIIADSTGRRLAVEDGWFDVSDSSRIVLITQPQVAKAPYFLRIPPDTLRFRFEGSTSPDTMALKVTANHPVNQARDVPEQAQGWVAFDDDVTHDSAGFRMYLTLGDSIDVPIRVERASSNRLNWSVIDPLPQGATCKILLDLRNLSDFMANPSIDTLWSVTFTIWEPSKTGSISGGVFGVDAMKTVIVSRLLSRSSSPDIFVTADASGAFTIDRLTPGRYKLWAFIDRDVNKGYNFGSLKPYQPSERITVYPDTVQVRERWDTAGLEIKFR